MVHETMLHGRAMGGPRDGVKLSATIKWDGRVSKGEGRTTGFYPGRYKWTGVTWRWYLDQVRPKSTTRQSPMYRIEKP